MLHAHRLLTGEDEAEPLPRLRRHIAVIVPAFDVVFEILLLGDKRGFLILEVVELGEVQRVRVERGDQLDGSERDDEQRHEERDRSGAVPLLRLPRGRMFRVESFMATKYPHIRLGEYAGPLSRH